MREAGIVIWLFLTLADKDYRSGIDEMSIWFCIPSGAGGVGRNPLRCVYHAFSAHRDAVRNPSDRIALCVNIAVDYCDILVYMKEKLD